MQTFDKIKELVASTEEDIEKFYSKGNSSAGSRIRKSMQELKKLAQEIRVNVQETKNKDKK